uniref:Uncharacterized protein n=1 Tax=Romanomermis culicivorax TaxID=13658 RepID=A0A915HIT4_ROMCU
MSNNRRMETVGESTHNQNSGRQMSPGQSNPILRFRPPMKELDWSMKKKALHFSNRSEFRRSTTFFVNQYANYDENNQNDCSDASHDDQNHVIGEGFDFCEGRKMTASPKSALQNSTPFSTTKMHLLIFCSQLELVWQSSDFEQIQLIRRAAVWSIFGLGSGE